jgi:hypothetical protein
VITWDNVWELLAGVFLTWLAVGLLVAVLAGKGEADWREARLAEWEARQSDVPEEESSAKG